MLTKNTILEAQEQAKTIGLFEALYVRSSNQTATYVIFKRRSDGMVHFYDDPSFFRTVGIFTGKTVETVTNLPMRTELGEAIAEHFNEDYVRNEGVVMGFEFCETFKDYRDMPTHPIFGQCVYYADCDELQVTDQDGQEWVIDL